MSKMKDITNQRFGRLVAKEPTSKRVHGSVVWKCECQCGETCEVSYNNLMWGGVQSCGCLQKEQHMYAAARLNSDRVDNTRLTMLTARTPTNNTSGTRGVCRRKDSRKWRAYITCQGKHIWLGSFDTKEEAIEARLKAERTYFEPILEKHTATETDNEELKANI